MSVRLHRCEDCGEGIDPAEDFKEGVDRAELCSYCNDDLQQRMANW